MLALALTVAAGLTGISNDFAHYRRGQTTVCPLATVDASSGMVLYGDACVEVPRPRQAKYAFSMPRASTRLPDGRKVIGRVVLQPKELPAGEIGCLTTKDAPCPSQAELRAMIELSPQNGDLIVVARAADGTETVLAQTGGTPREVQTIHVSPDGSKLIVVYTHEKMLRDSPREPPIGVEVLGVDIGARLAR